MAVKNYKLLGCADFDKLSSQILFRSPGGGELKKCEAESDSSVSFAYEEKEDTAVSSAWKKAQSAEKKFWKNWRNSEIYGKLDLYSYWKDVLDKTGGAFSAGVILDIGCGPVPALNFFRDSNSVCIGVDPLGEYYFSEKIIENAPDVSPMPIISCGAEKLPFADACFDHIVCFNVLDHVNAANEALSEIWRVLKPGGTARVFVHSFSPLVKKFLFFDKPHVFHWSHKEFMKILELNRFEIITALCEKRKFQIPKGIVSRLKNSVYIIAGLITYTSYFNIKVKKRDYLG